MPIAPTEVVQARGHWRLSIAMLPAASSSAVARFPVPALEDVIARAQVRLRGWYLPHVDRGESRYFGDFIEHGSDHSRYLERWRLYTDGVFLFQQALRDDWNERHELAGKSRTDKLNIMDVVFTLTEMFRFTERLGRAWNAHSVRVSLSLCGMTGRLLWMNDPRRASTGERHQTEADRISVATDLFKLVDLAERADEFSREAAVRAFEPFGWTPAPGVIESMQEELVRR